MNPSARDINAAPPRPIIVIGAGEHARVLIDVLRLLDREVLYVTDFNVERHGQTVSGVQVAGGDELVLEHDPESIHLVNGVGSIQIPSARRDVYKRFSEVGYHFTRIIHPSAIIAQDVTIGSGAQVMAGAVVQTNATLEENTLINTRSSIDHDCVIGAHTHIAPGVTLSGNVRIGKSSHIGTGATVIQAVEIGDNVVVGAGAVVVRDLADGVKAVGVPAKPLDDKPAPASPTIATADDDRTCNIMLSAAGRRVALLRLLRRSIHDLGLKGQVIATDIARHSSAYHDADISRIVPNYSDPACLDELLGLCREFSIKIIVPTIDPDLPFYARHFDKFAAIGTYIMVSRKQTIQIGNDKVNTHNWLVKEGFPTVKQTTPEEVLKNPDDWPYPLFVKPRRGSSSIGATMVRNETELKLATANREFIVQSLARGREYTVDVYIDRGGKCRCAVPRLRIETRGGEVNKGMTVRHELLQETAKRVAEALPGGVGVMNIQMFYEEESDQLNVIEINPRYGGGYPLSHEAGAPMTQWMIQEAMGVPPAIHDNWTNEFVMLRYDDAIFLTRSEAGLSMPVGRTRKAPIGPS